MSSALVELPLAPRITIASNEEDLSQSTKHLLKSSLDDRHGDSGPLSEPNAVVPPGERLFTRQEVIARNLVIYKGGVYDVSEFLGDHPGGAAAIIEETGQDIGAILHTTQPHSAYALDLLQRYRIGKLLETASRLPGEDEEERLHLTSLSQDMISKRDDNFLDASKPLVSQVLQAKWTKEYYLEQVHIPRYVAKSPPFFANPALNLFTICKWWGVLVVWTPVIYGLLHWSHSAIGSSLVLATYLMGLFLWSIYEYVFHRFLFHVDRFLPNRQWAFLLHFCMHGVHHLYPMDSNRLVMPPILMCFLAFPVANAWHSLLSAEVTAALMAGSLTGYVLYDMLHYYFHHGPRISGYLAFMKKYHMDHHYVNPNEGFGVSNILWDVAFHTTLPYYRANNGQWPTIAIKSSKSIRQ